MIAADTPTAEQCCADAAMHTAAAAVADHIACRWAPPVPITMPMVTLHWSPQGWREKHHGDLVHRLPKACQHNGYSDKGYDARLSGAAALIAARDANPGVDVQLIETVIQRNAYVLWAGKCRRSTT